MRIFLVLHESPTLTTETERLGSGYILRWSLRRIG